MKAYSCIKSLSLAGILAMLLAVGSCTEDGVADPEPNGEPRDTTKLEDPPGGETPNANEISSGLLLENATVHSGEIPAASHSADLKIDKDTLFFTEGIKNRIRILKPDELMQAIPSILIQVEGADEYFEIAPNELESTDSTLVIYMEFDPDPVKDNLPALFKIKIIPKDEDDNGVDDFTKVVVVEEKSADSCSPLSPHPNWVWIWTTTAGAVTAAPGMPVGTVATTNGCCMEGYSVDCIANAIPEDEWISLSYAAYSMANFEYISFSNDGSFIGGLTEQTQNLDYSESDFCGGEAAYIRNTRDNSFWGSYSYAPEHRQVSVLAVETHAREIYLEELDITVYDYDKTYVIPDAHYEIISCHYLIQTQMMEGKEVVRLFQRVDKIEFGGEYAYWYD